MCVGMFMAILDVQVVATSLPAIQGSLGIAPELLSWLQTAYLIAEIIAIPLTGVLTRLLSTRWLFVVALSVFTLASIGCASSSTVTTLLCWRVLQGFAGGTLIPSVFAAVFVLFPLRNQGLATMLAGVLAVLAPTVGPVVGGWITQTYSWHWLFLVNVGPGVLAAIGAALLLPKGALERWVLRTLDWVALALLAAALASLEIGLKEAPRHGWVSLQVVGLVCLAVACGLGFTWKSLTVAHPIVDLMTLKNPSFRVGCILSFALGIGLFGSVYLMPVFLGFVRGHNPLEIGTIMLATGAAQLATAPLAVFLEQKLNARVLSAAGFLLFGLGMALSAFQTTQTDLAETFWPQIVRGIAIMFCLLPPTRLALGNLPLDKVPDASGLFNLMRNLGGAVGLALIDTVIYGRAPIHAAAIAEQLSAGNSSVAASLGIPAALFASRAPGPLDASTQALVAPLIEKLALVQSINEAWMLIAATTLGALVFVPFARPKTPASVAILHSA